MGNTCENDRTKLELGMEVIAVQLGVRGPRGFIPLGKQMYFCTEKCVAEYFNGTATPQLDRKVP